MSAEAELALSLLWVTPDPARISRAQSAFSLCDDARLAAVLPKLEQHGWLPLFARNVAACGIALGPSSSALMNQRLPVLAKDAQRSLLTEHRVVTALAQHGVDHVLLKGASLRRDLYERPEWRALGDLDLLVDQRGLTTALCALAPLGFLLRPSQWPVWFYRRVHFHVKLHPSTHLETEVELHFALHAPALRLLARPADLWARKRALPGVSPRSFDLDRLDRFLHLATHLASHWGDDARLGTTDIKDQLACDEPLVRWKWVLDLVCSCEDLRAAGVSPHALSERILEWNAERPLLGVARLLQRHQLLGAEEAKWLWGAVSADGPIKDAALDAGSGSVARQGAKPLASFDFRLQAFALWPRWFWPERRYLVRRYAVARTPLVGTMLGRLVHGAGVLGATLRAALLLPVAWVDRKLRAGSRRAALKAAQSPERMIELIAAQRMHIDHS